MSTTVPQSAPPNAQFSQNRRTDNVRLENVATGGGKQGVRAEGDSELD